VNRTLFIKKILVFLGITSSSSQLIFSCKTEENDDVLTEEEKTYLYLKEKTSENGFFLDGKLLYIDTSNDLYSKLQNIGEFINDTNHYVLLLRKTEDKILALSNCCPHLGTSNRWSYSNGSFRCANHGNNYGTGDGSVANCSSNITSGNLKQYTVLINKDILTVDFDT
jgi:nitrite reductase/ring-hydroxylating ferredoxin subunit